MPWTYYDVTDLTLRTGRPVQFPDCVWMPPYRYLPVVRHTVKADIPIVRLPIYIPQFTRKHWLRYWPVVELPSCLLVDHCIVPLPIHCYSRIHEFFSSLVGFGQLRTTDYTPHSSHTRVYVHTTVTPAHIYRFIADIGRLCWTATHTHTGPGFIPGWQRLQWVRYREGAGFPSWQNYSHGSDCRFTGPDVTTRGMVVGPVERGHGPDRLHTLRTRTDGVETLQRDQLADG